jgi:hypothetical protein
VWWSSPAVALLPTRLAFCRCALQVKLFWDKRVRDLTPVIKSLLGVDNVWCDTRSEQNTQNFVLWAGYVLEQRWVAGQHAQRLAVACAGAGKLLCGASDHARVLQRAGGVS